MSTHKYPLSGLLPLPPGVLPVPVLSQSQSQGASSTTGTGSAATPPPRPPTTAPISSGAMSGSAVGGPGDEKSLRNNPNRWFFDKAVLKNTPSRKHGIGLEKELSYRQSAAFFIHEMGTRLKVNQLCSNTAVVYMNRFFMFHSFTHFHRNAISIAAIFLAAKVEEQPRKLDFVVRVSHYILFRNEPMIDSKSEIYANLCRELVENENILLQTLGFDLAVDHPHTHVVKCCQLVRATKDLSHAAYVLATNILQLTTMCVQYRPTLVATLAIHVACKWSGWEIPRSKEGKDWWRYVDDKCSMKELEELTEEYLDIYNKAPPKLRVKTTSFTGFKGHGHGQGQGQKVTSSSSSK